MCGIGLIVSGTQQRFPGIPSKGTRSTPCAFDILSALQARGPDSSGLTTLYTGKIEQLGKNLEAAIKFWSYRILPDDFFSLSSSCLWTEQEKFDREQVCVPPEFEGRFPCLEFACTTLQLRGTRRVCQPLQDKDGNILAYNGEIFGGLEVLPGENDTELLLERLGRCESSFEVCETLSRIRGPWAMIYFKASTRTLWFGRDAFGRRSLLVHWPSPDDPRLLLSSIAPQSNDKLLYDPFAFWEELPCGIRSLELGDGGVLSSRENAVEDPLVCKLMFWDRTFSCSSPSSDGTSAELVLCALRKSVARRLVTSPLQLKRRSDAESPVAVLFSGGIDSMILAALTDRCLDPTCTIDLLNVSFGGPSAPDRISALAGVEELRKISPLRKWRLVSVDESIDKHESKIMSLICPSQTYMDLNIGTALWCASRGEGTIETSEEGRVAYKSSAKVVLVGAGADEQCGGYLRYRTKFKLGRWEALAAEMRLDMQRLWKRNLGRDDRCIADHGKEARFPFLDEDVMQTLLDLPLEEIVDLREDIGIGDKKILRKVARLLGLSHSAALPKRAIQFGSGIAKKSNQRNFGSNRAANKASAGSVKLGNLE